MGGSYKEGKVWTIELVKYIELILLLALDIVLESWLIMGCIKPI